MADRFLDRSERAAQNIEKCTGYSNTALIAAGEGADAQIIRLVKHEEMHRWSTMPYIGSCGPFFGGSRALMTGLAQNLCDEVIDLGIAH